MTIDTKLITTTSAKVSSISVVDGQIIALSDKNAWYYDMGGIRHSVTGNIIDVNLPASGEADTLYIINNVDPEESGVYIWAKNQFVKICGLDNEKVKTEASTATKVYLVGSMSNVDGAETLVKNSGVFIDFSTKETSLIAASAKSADSAVSDSEGHAINETYIKGVTASKTGNTVVFTITKGDGSTSTFTVEDSDTTYAIFQGVQGSTDGESGLVPKPVVADAGKFLKADGTWANPVNTEYGEMTGASDTTAGSSGLVPAPLAGSQTKFLAGDGTWKDVETTDTKDTAGASPSTQKLYVVGTQTQDAEAKSYSNEKVYIENDVLHSNDKPVVTESDTQNLTNKTYEGYTLGNAVEKNVSDTIAENDENLPTSKAVYTAVQQILNDAKTYTNTEIGKVATLDIQVVAALPTSDISSRTIYLVPSTDPAEQNVKTEYMYINDNWEIIGSTHVDLSGYATSDDVNAVNTALNAAVATINQELADIKDSISNLSQDTGLSVVDGQLCITYES